MKRRLPILLALFFGAGPAFAAGVDTAPPAASPTPSTAAQTFAIYSYAEDPAAGPLASHLSEAISRKGQTEGHRLTIDVRLSELLDRSPDELVRSAAALATAHAAFKEGLELNSRLQLDSAQEALLHARSSLVEAAAAPDYLGLREVHLYLGIVALNLGLNDEAAAHFRTVVFLSPSLALNKDIFPPSVQEAFANAKRSLIASPKGALRIEVDGVRTATVVFDGSVKGNAPRTLTDLPEGEHYLEVRTPGSISQFIEVTVLPDTETPTIVPMQPAALPTLRTLWGEARGEAGAAAVARIIETDRLILASARTVGGTQAVVKAASFDASLSRRTQSIELTLPHDAGALSPKVQKVAQQLFQAATSGLGEVGTSYTALIAARERFLDRDQTLLTLEAGGAYQDHFFNGSGHSVPGTADAGNNGNGSTDFGFTHYTETRAILHARYGVKEGATLVLDLPVLARSLQSVDPNNGNKTNVSASGLGDVVVGADIRLPQYESPQLAMLYVSARVKLPTGADTTPDYYRHYSALIMGDGLWAVSAAGGGLVARGDSRLGFEAGYTFHVPGDVGYASRNGSPGYLDMGDEQHLHVDGAQQVLRWLAPEVDLDFTHRDSTKHFQDPITHNPALASEMDLLNVVLAARAQLSETTEAGAGFQYPLWGKDTKTFFPLDVTGPRGWVYYGVRF